MLFLSGVSADSIVASGLAATEYYIKDAGGVRIYFQRTHMSRCSRICRFPGVEQVWKVQFLAPGLANECDDCSGYKAGLRIRLVRVTNPTFDHETYLDSFSTFVYEFEDATSTTTAANVATDFIAWANADDSHSGPRPFEVVTDPSDGTGATVLITSKHPDIQFKVSNVRYYPKNVITLDTEHQSSILGASTVARKFPLGIGFIPGQNPDESWQGCKNPCVIIVKGCLPGGCSDADMVYNSHNAVPLHAVNTPFDLELWVNADDAGYAAFVTALNTALDLTCTDATPELPVSSSSEEAPSSSASGE